jgi:hypothetical protein
MHELVHLVEGHHGPEFWQALGRAMPDWQKRKDALADKAKDYLVFGLPTGRAASRLGAAGEKYFPAGQCLQARSRCGGQPALNGPIQHLRRLRREATVWPASTGQTT